MFSFRIIGGMTFGQTAPSRLPGRLGVVRRVVGPPGLPGAVGIHHVDVDVAVAIGEKTMRVPSGDQAGDRSLAATCVKRVCAEPSAFIA